VIVTHLRAPRPIWLLTSSLRARARGGASPRPTAALRAAVYNAAPIAANQGLWGLARTVRTESAGFELFTVDLCDSDELSASLLARCALLGRIRIAGSVRGLHVEFTEELECAFSGGQARVPRLTVHCPMRCAVYDAAANTAGARSADGGVRLESAAVDAINAEEMAAAALASVDESARSIDWSVVGPTFEAIGSVALNYACHAAAAVHERDVVEPFHLHLLAWCRAQAVNITATRDGGSERPADASAALEGRRLSDAAGTGGAGSAHNDEGAPPDAPHVAPSMRATYEQVCRIGASLTGVLRGEVDYQELLFPRGSFEAVRPFYESNMIATLYNTAMEAAAQAVVSRPMGIRGLDVLEVGAGTGATAARLLPVLAPRCARYIFTDVSEIFLRKAAERFGPEFVMLETALLNICADPRLQGFSAHELDLVVAANALHATPDIDAALRYCAQLLRPAGVLLLKEAVRLLPFVQVVFGMTDGWWVFKADPRRAANASPLLDVSEWGAAMRASGMGHVHVVNGTGQLACEAVVIAQAHPTAAASSRLAPELGGGAPASAIVTGGLGGLGLVTARLLAARHDVAGLVLASRSGRVQRMSEGDWESLLAEVAARSVCRVHTICCDVSVPSEARALVGRVAAAADRETFLRYVYHAAGVLADGVLTNQSAWTLRTVFGPKVHGAAALHRAVAKLARGLTMVMTSSIASLLGAPGQSNHAAANSWLNGLAVMRTAVGLHGHSSQWGAVEEVGYAARHADVDRLSVMRGVSTVCRAQSIHAIELALFGPSSPIVMAILPADWRVLNGRRRQRGRNGVSSLPFFEGMRSRFGAMGERREAGHRAATGPGDAETATVAAVSLEEVLDAVQTVLGSGETDADAPLLEIGIDSLGAVELRNQLQPFSGEQLPSTLVFDHPTARHLHALLAAAAGQASEPATSATVPLSPSGGRMRLCGSSSRWPGGAEGAARACRLVEAGVDALGAVPKARWILPSGLPQAVQQRASHGGFMAGADLFDNDHFGVSSAEATMMDPQQRLLLEHGYVALHSAGELRTRLLGSPLGVFVGISYTEYAPVAQAKGFSVYGLTGSGHCFAAGRLSFVLGVVGPCVAYDTACSASLVACNGASYALAYGECSQALLAGVNMMISPTTPILLATGGMTSLSGRSHTFDARADGFARAEACVAMALRPVAHIETGQPFEEILGVAVRQDGKSASLTAPSGSAQQQLLRAAFAKADVSAAETCVVEAHGTGTQLGDPIEMGSCAAVVMRGATADGAPSLPLVGGVKANLGHAEPAAGAVGLLNLALRMRRGLMCPNARLRILNPHVLDAVRGRTGLLPTQPGRLPTRPAKRTDEGGGCPSASFHIGGVSSFGLGGTIAHALGRANSSVVVGGSAGAAYLSSRPLLRRRRFAWAGAQVNEASREVKPTARLKGVVLTGQMDGTAAARLLEPAVKSSASAIMELRDLTISFDEDEGPPVRNDAAGTVANSGVLDVHSNARDAKCEGAKPSAGGASAQAGSTPAAIRDALVASRFPLISVTSGSIGQGGLLLLLHSTVALAHVEATICFPSVCTSGWLASSLRERLHSSTADSLAGRSLSAAEGLELGLVDFVGGDGDLEAELARLCARLGQLKPSLLSTCFTTLPATSLDTACVSMGAINASPMGPVEDHLVQLRLDRRTGVAHLELHDPQHFNAFSPGLGNSVLKAVVAIERMVAAQPSTIKAVLLTGKGKHFSVGGNPHQLKSVAKLSLPVLSLVLREVYNGFLKLSALPVPVVAAVHGSLVGGALAGMLHADFVVAEAAATFEHGNLPRGVCPLGMLSRNFVAAVGRSFALDVYLRDRKLSAQAALEAGLVQEVVVGVADAKRRAERIAEALAERPDLAALAMETRLPIDVELLNSEAVGHASCLRTNQGMTRSRIACVADAPLPRLSPAANFLTAFMASGTTASDGHVGPQASHTHADLPHIVRFRVPEILGRDPSHPLGPSTDQLSASLVIMTGASPENFCLGGDPSAARLADGSFLDGLAAFRDIIDVLQQSPMPTIAAVGGRCRGGGMLFPCAATIVIASPNATFGFPEIRRAALPGFVSVAAKRRLTPAACRRLFCTGDSIGAQEAARLGLVDYITDEGEDVDSVAQVLATHMRALGVGLLQRCQAALLGRRGNGLLCNAEGTFGDETQRLATAMASRTTVMEDDEPDDAHDASDKTDTVASASRRLAYVRVEFDTDRQVALMRVNHYGDAEADAGLVLDQDQWRADGASGSVRSQGALAQIAAALGALTRLASAEGLRALVVEIQADRSARDDEDSADDRAVEVLTPSRVRTRHCVCEVCGAREANTHRLFENGEEAILDAVRSIPVPVIVSCEGRLPSRQALALWLAADLRIIAPEFRMPKCVHPGDTPTADCKQSLGWALKAIRSLLREPDAVDSGSWHELDASQVVGLHLAELAQVEPERRQVANGERRSSRPPRIEGPNEPLTQALRLASWLAHHPPSGVRHMLRLSRPALDVVPRNGGDVDFLGVRRALTRALLSMRDNVDSSGASVTTSESQLSSLQMVDDSERAIREQRYEANVSAETRTPRDFAPSVLSALEDAEDALASMGCPAMPGPQPLWDESTSFVARLEAYRRLQVATSTQLSPYKLSGVPAPLETATRFGEIASVGLVAIEIYCPRYCVDAAALERHIECAAGEITTHGLMQEFRTCGLDEDTISMAKTALWRLMRARDVKPSDVGMLQVASPSILDRSKSLKSELMELFEAHGVADLEGVDSVCSTLGGNEAILKCVAWVESNAWDGRWAIAVCIDSPGPGDESGPHLIGSAAVAALIGPDASVAVSSVRSTSASHTWDECYRRPLPHGMESRASAGRANRTAGGAQDVGREHRSLDLLTDVCDVTGHMGCAGGYVRLVAHMARCPGDALRLLGPSLTRIVSPSLHLSARIGGTPACSLLLGVASALRTATPPAGSRIGVVSLAQDSLSALELEVRRALPGASSALDTRFDMCVALTPKEFLALYSASCNGAGRSTEHARAVLESVAASMPTPCGAFYVANVNARGLRTYRLHCTSTLDYGASPPIAARPAAPQLGGAPMGALDPLAKLLAVLSGQAAADPRMALDAVVLKVRGLATDLLGHEVEDDVPLMDAGLDSLAGVEFGTRLSDAFPSVSVSETLIFDHPTVRDVAEYVHEQLAHAEPASMEHAAEGDVVTRLAALLGDAAGSTHEDVAARLAQVFGATNTSSPAPVDVHEALAEIATALLDENASWDAPLMEAGLDSLGIVDFRERLQARIGDDIDLPDTLTFEYPTLRLVEAHLLERSGVANQGGTSLCGTTEKSAGVSMVGVPSSDLQILGQGSAYAPEGLRTVPSLLGALDAGADLTGLVPLARWDADASVLPCDSALMASRMSAGAFMLNVERFDAAAFGISSSEAAAMDPQQRLLLEGSYMAMHSAGGTRPTVLRSMTGVAVALHALDFGSIYGSRVLGRSPYATTAASLAVAAGRISYVFGMNGPSRALETGCSASLVAAHTASHSLRARESTAELIAGVNLLLAPHGTIGCAAAGMTSATGKCHVFDARADGYVKGEAMCCLVMAPAETADGVFSSSRKVGHGRLLGSGVEQDGRSASLVAPNGAAQVGLMTRAAVRAGVASNSIALFEAHGTGTALGDPVEVRSISAQVKSQTMAGSGLCTSPAALGGGKASYAHSETAAGLHGVMKAVHALHSNAVAPNARLRVLSAHVALQRAKGSPMLYFGVQLSRLPSCSRKHEAEFGRAAGINSFGYAGTIAHALVGCHATCAPKPLPMSDGPILTRRFFPWRVVPHPLLTTSAALTQVDGHLVLHTAERARLRELVHDHRIRERVVVPAAALLEMVRATRCFIARSHANGAAVLLDVTFRRPLTLSEDEPDVQASACAGSAHVIVEFSASMARFEVRDGVATAVSPTESSTFTTYSSGESVSCRTSAPCAASDLREAQGLCKAPLDVSCMYETLRASGVVYGPKYRSVHQAWRNEASVMASIRPARVERRGVAAHPCELDGALHVGVALCIEEGDGAPMRLPVGAGSVTLRSPLSNGPLWAVLKTAAREDPLVDACNTMLICGPHALVEFDVRAFRTRDAATARTLKRGAHPFYATEWILVGDRFEHEVHVPASSSPVGELGLIAATGDTSARRLADSIVALHSPTDFSLEHPTATGACYSRVRDTATLQPRGQGPLLFVTAGQVDELTAVHEAVGLLVRSTAHHRPVWLLTCSHGPRMDSVGREHFESKLASNELALTTVGGGLRGLARAARLEAPLLRIYCADVAGPHPASLARLVLCATQDCVRLLGKQLPAPSPFAVEETELAFVGGRARVPRLTLTCAPSRATQQADDAFVFSLAMVEAAICDAVVSADAKLGETTQAEMARLDQEARRWAEGARQTPMHRVNEARHRHLLSWCLQLDFETVPASSSCAEQTPPHLKVDSTPSNAVATSLLQSNALLSRVGNALQQLLTGQIDCARILYPETERREDPPIHGAHPLACLYDDALASVATAIAGHLPDGHRVCVLQLGAGTFQVAHAVLPILEPHCERYIVSDVSDSVLAQARRRFAAHARVEVARLDIDFDPRLQGFCNYELDLLIAAHSLHLVRSINLALQHCARLLRPGGFLLVKEAPFAPVMTTLICGTTEAWWRFKEDPARRHQASPCLAAEEWQHALHASGFAKTCSSATARCALDERAGQIPGQFDFIAAQTVLSSPPLPPAKADDRVCRLQSAVITGGLGGLGLLASCHLASSPNFGALLLASRTGRVQMGSEGDWNSLLAKCSALRRGADGVTSPTLGRAGTPGKERQHRASAPSREFREASDTPCELYVICCDIADTAHARALVGTAIGLGALGNALELHTIYHAAGALADGILQNQTHDTLRAVFGAKVHGAASLHCTTSAQCGITLALTSSVASLLGSPGQSNHASASSWLDALAVMRRAAGLKGQSSQWGAVANVGYAARHADLTRLLRGMRPVSRDVASTALHLALASRPCATVLAVAPIDWDGLGLVPRGRGSQSLLAGIVSRCALTYGEGAREGMSIQGSAGSVQSLSLNDVVKAVRSVCSSATADADTPLLEAGLDSLGAVELTNQLQLFSSELLPATLVFDYPTARLLHGSLSPTSAPRLVVERPRPAGGLKAQGVVEVTAADVRLPCTETGLGNAVALVSCGADSVGEVPATRWVVPESSNITAQVRQRVSHGGFMLGAEFFDNAHFAVSQAEAALMDPQQRLLLEHGYRALHAADMPRAKLLGSTTGVFVGISYTEFAPIAMAMSGSVHSLTGSGHCFAAGRLSFALGLVGACVAYDTACSAGIVACGGARAALQQNECDQALLAGVNMMISPATPLLLAIGGMTSLSGRSHTFDARADGFARAEACIAVALRAAGADAEETTSSSVLGHLLSVAVRQDGKSASLTAPNGTAQQLLIRASVARSGVALGGMGVIECHGTGTALGDPIEMGALAATILYEASTPSVPLVGALKGNLGHAEPAAGTAGLLSMMLRLERQDVGPNAQLRIVNSHVLASLRVKTCVLPTQLGGVALGGEQATPHGTVSAFGLGGTIAHAIARGLRGMSRWSLEQAELPLLAYRRRAYYWPASTLGSALDAGEARGPVLLVEQVEAVVLRTLREFCAATALAHLYPAAAESLASSELDGEAIRDDTLLDTPFSELGLDSLATVSLSFSLQSELQSSVPAEMIASAVTPRKLSESLAAMAGVSDTESSHPDSEHECLRARIAALPTFNPLRLDTSNAVRGPLRSGGRVLYYLPGAPGACLADFALLCTTLEGFTVVGFPYSDLVGSCGGEPSISALGLCLAERILTLHFGSAYESMPPGKDDETVECTLALAGFSLGAMLCVEVANELSRRGQTPQALIQLDPLPFATPSWLRWTHGLVARAAAARLVLHMESSLTPYLKERLDPMQHSLRNLIHAALQHACDGEPEVGASIRQLVVRAADQSVGANLRASLVPYASRFSTWASKELPCVARGQDTGCTVQASLAERRVEVKVEGSHFTFIQSPRLAARTARHVEAFLEGGTLEKDSFDDRESAIKGA